jgi:hypothetical protein
MFARQPTFLHWTEAAEAAEVCAEATLEREPQPGAPPLARNMFQAPGSRRRWIWPRALEWLAWPGQKSMRENR